MSKIILPSELVDTPTKDEIFRHQQYIDNPKVKKLADEIHESRLIGGPAENCDQCIKMALMKLKMKTYE